MAIKLLKNQINKILFEDNNLIVVDKKSGINSIDISSLICHRLDRDTSGILIIAKNQQIKDKIQKQFKNHTILKEYYAIVLGKLDEQENIEGYVVRDKKNINKRKFFINLNKYDDFNFGKKHQKFSQTKIYPKKIYYKNIFDKKEQDNLNYFSLIKARPITGRTHQIRLHAQYLHYPILGDSLYGGKIMKKIIKKLKISRLMLHAYKIVFKNPENNQITIIKSHLPAEFKKIIKNFRII